MEEAGVAVLLASPEWMDREAIIVEEAAAFGCKCSHRLTRPEYCVALDDVGGGNYMKGDGLM